MNKVIILAAGKGTRMKNELPKVLVNVKGKPMIQYLMEAVGRSGICDRPIVVVSPDNQNLIKEALKGFVCDFAIQEKQLGTGHAFAAAKDLIGPEVKNLVSLYGDNPFLRPASIKELTQVHRGVLTMMTTALPDFDNWHSNFYHWGRIVRGAAGEIEEIVEFKDAPEEIKKITEVNPGLFCFDSAWLWENIDKLQNNNHQQEYYLTDMVKIAFKEGHKIASFPISPRESIGINSREELDIAEKLLDNFKK